jgi:hypothetical protein
LRRERGGKQKGEGGCDSKSKARKTGHGHRKPPWFNIGLRSEMAARP